MHYFNYKNKKLFCENVSLEAIAKSIGTPCYVYSTQTIERHYRAFTQAAGKKDALICYSVKANSNLSILKFLSKLGAGFDIVSEGELFRVLKAGGDPRKVVFSGVGKTESEMRYALKHAIFCFNVESNQELEKLNAVAVSLNKKAPVSLRVNPNINAKTHPYISTGLKENKFGISMTEAQLIYRNRSQYPAITFTGIDCHIGSQMLSLKPIIATLKELRNLVLALKSLDVHIEHLNLGGGLGIRYSEESPPSPRAYMKTVIQHTKDLNVKLLFEPGRAIMGNAGILLTRVLYKKNAFPFHKSFIIVDAAMNDLIRPSLYHAYQDIWPVHKKKKNNETVDVVGPICESGDFFAKNRSMKKTEAGDLLAIMGSGAYGFSMASNYNSRRRAAEVLVTGKKYNICRTRESFEDLIQGEAP